MYTLWDFCMLTMIIIMAVGGFYYLHTIKQELEKLNHNEKEGKFSRTVEKNE